MPGAPWLYAVGTVQEEGVIFAGTDLARLQALNPSWKISGEFGESGTGTREDGLLAGEKAVDHFGWKTGQIVELQYGEERVSLPLLGILSTGGSEDSQLLLPLAVLRSLTGQSEKLSLIQLAAPGSAAQVESFWRELASQFPQAEVRPVRPVLESEARVVMKIRWLMLGLTVVVLALVILSVLTTVSGLVLDRQRDIGVMKALGGSERRIAAFFLAETACLAAVAGVLGYSLGFGLAQWAWAAQRMFQSTVALRADVFAAVLGTTIFVALLATAVPVRWIRRMEPAVILRGE
jgi:putative ABC transport system permease protein